MSRDHPSAVLKATTRTGLLNRRPSSRLVITVSKSVSSTFISLQARPIGPKSSSTKQMSRSMPGTIDGDEGIPELQSNRRARFRLQLAETVQATLGPTVTRHINAASCQAFSSVYQKKASKCPVPTRGIVG